MRVVADRDGLQDLDGGTRGVLLHCSRAFDQEHERRRTAIHDRDFGTVNFDQDVVDFASCQSGHKVLDRADRSAVIVSDRRREPGIDHVLPVNGDFPGTVKQVGSTDADAEIFFRRFQRQGGLTA